MKRGDSMPAAVILFILSLVIFLGAFYLYSNSENGAYGKARDEINFIKADLKAYDAKQSSDAQQLANALARLNALERLENAFVDRLTQLEAKPVQTAPKSYVRVLGPVEIEVVEKKKPALNELEHMARVVKKIQRKVEPKGKRSDR